MSATPGLALDFPDIPDGVTPIDGVLLMKALDEDGKVVLYQRFTTGISSWEALGLVEAAGAVLRRDMADYFMPMDSGDDADGGDR